MSLSHKGASGVNTPSTPNFELLLRNGWPIIPVYFRQKRPIGDNWQVLPVTLERMLKAEKEHGQINIGCRCGDRVAGIDIDVSADHPKFEEIKARLEAKLGVSPLSRWGRKGCLLPYRVAHHELPQDRMRKRKLKLGDDVGQIEVLLEGQQFVMFGPHPITGDDYAWGDRYGICGGPDPTGAMIAELPLIDEALIMEALADVARLMGVVVEATPERPAEPSPLAGEPVTAEYVRELWKHVNRKMPRDKWRDAIAATRAAPGVDPEALRQIALEAADQAYHEEVEKIFDTMPPKAGGVGFGTLVKLARDGGYLGPSMSEVFANVEAPQEPAKERSRYAPVDLLQMATGPEPEYHDDDEGHGRGLMPDYAEGAIGYHYARPGQHKTNCLLCESLEAVKRGKNVVFVAAEGTYEFVRVRLTVACREMGLTLEQLINGGDGPLGPLGRLAVIGDAPPLLDTAEVHAFMDALPWAPHIVIIDTLSEALPGADQSSTVTTSGVGHAAKLIKKRFKCLVILIHHPGKDESRGLLGGQGYGGHGDFVIHYTYDEDAGTVAAYVEKMRSGTDHFSKGFRVRQVDYHKRHKLTGEPITLKVPVVERIPVDEWAAMLATEAKGGVRAIVDPSIPAGMDDAVRPLFELLRRLDREDRAAGRPSQEHRVTDLIEKLHVLPQGADWATQEQQRLDINAHGEAIKRRKAKAEKDRCGALWELAVKDAAGNIRVRPAIFLKLPDNYREPGTKT